MTRFTANQRADLRRDVIGFIFQFFALVPVLSAYENGAAAAAQRDQR
ncbi:MAG: hypothetical protein R2911_14355 [Caldilineaceae bacterium]